MIIIIFSEISDLEFIFFVLSVLKYLGCFGLGECFCYEVKGE